MPWIISDSAWGVLYWSGHTEESTPALTAKKCLEIGHLLLFFPRNQGFNLLASNSMSCETPHYYGGWCRAWHLNSGTGGWHLLSWLDGGAIYVRAPPRTGAYCCTRHAGLHMPVSTVLHQINACVWCARMPVSRKLVVVHTLKKNLSKHMHVLYHTSCSPRIESWILYM